MHLARLETPTPTTRLQCPLYALVAYNVRRLDRVHRAGSSRLTTPSELRRTAIRAQPVTIAQAQPASAHPLLRAVSGTTGTKPAIIRLTAQEVFVQVATDPYCDVQKTVFSARHADAVPNKVTSSVRYRTRVLKLAAIAPTKPIMYKSLAVEKLRRSDLRAPFSEDAHAPSLAQRHALRINYWSSAGRRLPRVRSSAISGRLHPRIRHKA